jgi:hypothetical protein
MDKVHEPIDSEHFTPYSEPFRLYKMCTRTSTSTWELIQTLVLSLANKTNVFVLIHKTFQIYLRLKQVHRDLDFTLYFHEKKIF